MTDLECKFRDSVPTRALPRTAYVIEKPDHDYGLFWNIEDSSTEKVEDELVRRKDVKTLIQDKIEENSGESVVQNTKQAAFEELLDELEGESDE